MKMEQKIKYVSSQPREQWSRKIEFIFACVGFAVGYGNFWRFPFKCFKNGGGAFLIPFILCLILAGIPLFFLELGIGQYSQAGPLKAWNGLCPLMSGIGYAMIVICALVSIYYNVILAWSCYYFFNSFMSQLPWVGCKHEWSSVNCYDPFQKNISSNMSAVMFSSPSKEFFIYNVLNMSKGIDNMGSLNWKPMCCLMLSWILVYFCIWKGIRTTGKVVYITATLPYIMLFVFLIRGLTLDGAMVGIKYYVTPVWGKLLEPQVWVDAASQVFYSLTIGFGVMLTFASYNKSTNNLYRDAFLIGVTDAATSIFSGFVVFAIIGYMAELQHKLIDDPSIATDGPGLVFIVYPAALATLPQPHIWSVIFFLMLITLGLDSQFGQVELICACIMERYPKVLEKRKEVVVLLVCIVLCLFGLVCVSEGGMYWFHLIDTYSAGSSLLFVGSIELVTVAWIYGAEKFKENIESMVGFKISYIWVIIWKFITPVITIGIFLFGLINHKRLTFEVKYTYPDWAEALGWLMSLASMLCIPVVALKKIVQTDGSLRERLRVLTTPCLEDRTEKDINDEAQYLASAM